MKLAIMQPYFFPYLGQFQLIKAVDRFVLCDDVQYIRHGWINRNRILKQGNESEYITVPISKHKITDAIKHIKIVDGNDWKVKMLRQIDYYRKIAPNYTSVAKLLGDCLALEERNITRLNGHCLQAVCNYLDIDFKVEISSELGLDYSHVQNTEDWSLTICGQLGATQYFNPHGGMHLYKKEVFDKHGIQLNFIKPNLTRYNQHFNGFVPALSIIDVMMFNSKAQIQTMLNDYQLL